MTLGVIKEQEGEEGGVGDAYKEGGSASLSVRQGAYGGSSGQEEAGRVQLRIKGRTRKARDRRSGGGRCGV